MAKRNDYPSYLLFISAGILIAAGWLMASFPILIFLGFAPVFALTDRTHDSPAIFEKMEWILLSLTISFLSAHHFDFSFLVSSMLYAILFTLPFAAHVWVRRTLGHRVGKMTIVIFWLTLEYVMVKINPTRSIFLGDALRLQPEWVRWNSQTGYLGASSWILVVNLAAYQALLSKNAFAWPWILTLIVSFAGPLVYSLYMDTTPISRTDMVTIYSGETGVKDVVYLARTELVVRTAAWLSTLILLFTFVKGQTTR